jgi:copper chaperone CopZ
MIMANEIIAAFTETRFKISNMVCEGCAEKITSILKALPGVQEVKSKVFQKQIQVNYNRELTRQEDMKNILENEGYNPIEI